METRAAGAEDRVTPSAFELGWDALKGGDPNRAEALFLRAISEDPSGPLAEDARYWRAVALGRTSRSEEAVLAFEDFIDRCPRSLRRAEAACMVGWILLESGEAARARMRFEEALGAASPAQSRIRESARRGLDAIARNRGR